MTVLRFGNFEIDSGRRLLVREGTEIHLSLKAFHLLEILIDRRPNALSKQQLYDEIWPGTFVSESNLASLIAEVRGALDDDARSPLFIRTIHAFGYAFCGEAAEVGPASPKAGLPLAVVDWNGKHIVLGQGENVIGRDPSAAVFIDDPTVSRHHAVLMIAPNRATLRDLGSKNGTFLGDRRIESVELQGGSEFRVGAINLNFSWTTATDTTLTMTGASPV